MFMGLDPMQEEFFCGSSTRYPILLLSLVHAGSPSGEPTVCDLRQYIADDLQMSDSTELIDLVVANQIV